MMFTIANWCSVVAQGTIPVLGAFRFPISGHKADGKRWWDVRILALGARRGA